VPVTIDSTVQSNSGHSVTSAGTFDVTLPAGTTDGNTVLVFVASTSATGVTAPAGFTTDKTMSVGGFFFRKSEVPAGETTWTFTVSSGTTRLHSWYVEENSDIDPVEPLEGSAGPNTAAGTINGGTLTTSTTTQGAAANTVAYGIWISNRSDATWSNYTNGFEEVFDTPSGANPADYQITVARKFTDASIQTYESTATLATAQGGGPVTFAAILVYRAKDAAIANPLVGIFGFDWGTHGGITAGGSANSLVGAQNAAVGTWGIDYSIGSSFARTTGYGLEINQTGTAAYVPLGTLKPTGTKGGCFGYDVCVVSGTGVVVVAEGGSATGTVYSQLVYDTSATKFGVRAGTTGTIQYAATTTALNTFVWLDYSVKTTSSIFEVRWRLETGTNTYTDQTTATLTGQTTNTFYNLRAGANVAQTMKAHFDNVVMSPYYAAYPLGPHVVKLLKVDPAGTPSVSGTSTNFSVFTANGTLAAWDATNARNAVDEVPPTVSASADGVVQTAVATADYMEFPMETYTCAVDEIIAAVRALAAEWGGTGSGTGTLGMRGYDGTAEAVLIGTISSHDAGSPTVLSTVDPMWMTAMWTPSGAVWTQAKLDAAAVRIGFSNDATPDMGVHAIYLEVAIRKAKTVRQFTLENPISATADSRVNPYSSASVSYLITNNDATRSVNFNYTGTGTPSSPVTVGPSTSQEVTVTADVFGDIPDVSLVAI